MQQVRKGLSGEKIRHMDHGGEGGGVLNGSAVVNPEHTQDILLYHKTKTNYTYYDIFFKGRSPTWGTHLQRIT